MKNSIVIVIFASLLAFGPLAACGCGSDKNAGDAAPAQGLLISAAPDSKTPEAPDSSPADATAPAPVARPPESTAGPAAANTGEPVLNSQTPSPEPPDIPEGDRELLVLVNFEHPIYSEPQVELIAEALTANNVTCDPRRHANARAIAALDEMLTAAQTDGEYHFVIASAFRSLWEQEILWNGRSNQDPAYGSDPHSVPVSVMPKNCSEHTTGLAFDILCDNCPHSDPTFASTAEGRWLMQNAWKYGFVLRYPANKQNVTGVQYEPWHYRYVGKAAAQYMHEHGLCLEELVGMLQNT